MSLSINIYIYIYIHTYIYKGFSYRGAPSQGKIPPERCGRSSEVHVLDVLPDPGALNSYMHAFPDNNAGLDLP